MTHTPFLTPSIFRAHLPEHDFGKMIAKNNYLATGRDQPFGREPWDISRDGMMVMLEALFGNKSFKQVHAIFCNKQS